MNMKKILIAAGITSIISLVSISSVFAVGFVFNTNLQVGSSDTAASADVSNLQTWLISNG